MELSSAWEASSRSATQTFLCILENPKVHYHINKSPSLVLIFRHISPVHTIPFYLCKTNFNIVLHLSLGLASGIFCSCYSTNILYACLFSFRATCHAYLIFLHLIILFILGEKYKLWNSSFAVLYNFIFLGSKYSPQNPEPCRFSVLYNIS
jgi:hypothetical protein